MQEVLPKGRASLKDLHTGVAWLSSARDLSCSLKWGNERNPYSMLDMSSKTAQLFEHKLYVKSVSACEQKAGRKVGMTSNQHGPLMPWATLMLQWSIQWVAKP